MPSNEELLQALTRLSLLETQVAAIDGRLRNVEMGAAATGAGLQNIQGAIGTVVSDLITSRDKVTDRLFQVIDQTNKITTTTTTGTSATVAALDIATTDTAMK